MAVDSFKKRYLYKLTTNLINFFIAFLTVGIIPRALGVNTYGNYTFINNVFSQVLSFLEFRTSTCFFVKLSQNQNDKKILLFYLIYSLILLLCLTIVSTLIIAIHQIYQFIFGVNTIPHFLLFILFFYTFFNWLSETLSSALDSLGFTVYLEKVRILNKIFSALSILGLYHLKLLNLSTLITVQILLVIILIILLIFYLTRKKVYDTNLTRSDFSNYTKVFYKYSFPLFGYLVFQFTGNFFDRWYLQQEGGSFQQGIYSFSYSLMNFCYLFINAFQPLVTREFSITVGKNDKQTMSVLFQKFNSILFAVTGYLCAFIFVEAKEIIQFFGGDDYLVSTRVLQILMLYPLISTYSLLNGAILYSTEKTRLLFKLSFVLTPIGILLLFSSSIRILALL
jgi:O-antigen/teichoic acid export membrane protein